MMSSTISPWSTRTAWKAETIAGLLVLRALPMPDITIG